MKNRCNKIDAKKTLKDAIGAIVGAIKALKDALTEVWGDAKLGLLQIRALAKSLTGDHAAKATRSELGAVHDAHDARRVAGPSNDMIAKFMHKHHRKKRVSATWRHIGS